MNTQVIFPKTRTTRQLRKRVPLDGGFTTVADGVEEIFFETSIDLLELNDMARKAAGNRNGKSRDGALIVRVVERRRL